MWIYRLRTLSFLLAISTPIALLSIGGENSGFLNILISIHVYVFIALIIMVTHYSLRRRKPCHLLRDVIGLTRGFSDIIVDTRRRLAKLKEIYDLVISSCLSS